MRRNFKNSKHWNICISHQKSVKGVYKKEKLFFIEIFSAKSFFKYITNIRTIHFHFQCFILTEIWKTVELIFVINMILFKMLAVQIVI